MYFSITGLAFSRHFASSPAGSSLTSISSCSSSSALALASCEAWRCIAVASVAESWMSFFSASDSLSQVILLIVTAWGLYM